MEVNVLIIMLRASMLVTALSGFLLVIKKEWKLSAVAWSVSATIGFVIDFLHNFL